MNKTLKRISYSLITITFMLTLLYIYMDKETKVLNAESREHLNGQFTRLDMGSVHYQLEGDANAKTVVLVHGFSSPFYIFDPTFDYLTEKGFRVLRFDLFGRGYSDRPESDYSIDVYVEQLHQLLAKLHIKEKVSLVGLSMGGAIVTHFTNRYPEQVEKITLIDPLFHTPERPEITAIKLPGIGEYLAKVLIVPKFINGVAETVFNPDTFPDWADKFEPQTHYKGFSSAIVQTARFLAGKNFKNEYVKLGSSGKQVQLFWGKQDQVIPIADASKIRALVPTIEYHEIDEAGHLPHYEQAEKVNPLISHFLQSD